jgi:diguanylate cyclase
VAALTKEEIDMAVTLEEMMQLTVRGREGAAKTPFQPPPHLRAGSEGYYRRIEEYARRIRSTRDVGRIVAILDEALSDTRALHGADESSATEQRLRQAENEIETLKAELERTVALSNIDPLTGLLNRRGLESGFIAEAARSDRHGTSLCIALIDLDDFKQINDSFGHPAGDAALTHFAKTMRATLRPNDVLARVGGEEFMVLLPNSNEQAAFAALNRLLKAVTNNAVVCMPHRITLTFTSSVAARAFGEPQANVEERLDAALYRAKHSGKNRVVFTIAG